MKKLAKMDMYQRNAEDRNTAFIFEPGGGIDAFRYLLNSILHFQNIFTYFFLGSHVFHLQNRLLTVCRFYKSNILY